MTALPVKAYMISRLHGLRKERSKEKNAIFEKFLRNSSEKEQFDEYVGNNVLHTRYEF